jgi:creatinine amidohydrolase
VNRESTRFGDFTFQEIQRRADEGWLAVVPTGCTEQQGPHLPVDFDTWFVESVCLAGARRGRERYELKALILPAMPFGPTREHRGYGSGYIHLPQAVHEAVVSSILESLAEQGFRRMVVWRGCGGHDLTGVVGRFNGRHEGEPRAFQPELPYDEVWCRIADPSIPGGHADSFATSIALYLRPGSVCVERIPEPEGKPVDWDDPELDFARYSPTGVMGDATHASAELGARLWDAVLDEVASILWRIAEA